MKWTFSILYRFYIPILSLALCAYSANINWKNGQWEHVLQADAKGYYAYLPAAFVYQDLNFEFYEKVDGKKAYDSTLVYDYRVDCNGHSVNRYFVGVSVLVSPFFLISHQLSQAADTSPDGYSQLYIIGLTLAAVFYLFVGIIALHRLLLLLQIPRLTSAISISTIVLGTNLFYYTVGEPGMSHVYSFSMISIFMYQVTRFLQSGRSKHFILASVLLGIVILIRPINALIVLIIPFLAKDWLTLKHALKTVQHKRFTQIASILSFLAIVSIQFILYKVQTGQFLVDTYGGEGFTFAHPMMWQFLFSFKKGFFLYTPVCFISLIGLYAYRKNRFQMTSIVIFLTVLVYVLSSWWMWYYGGSFSSRVMVDYLAVFTILLATTINLSRSKIWKISCFSLIVLLIGLNQIQTLQYRYKVIHWSEMTQEKYLEVFLDLTSIIQRKMK